MSDVLEWPQGRLPIRVEMALGSDPAGGASDWEWTDVTAGMPQRILSQGITITSGRADESSQAQPASVSLELDNGDGWLTPDYPLSPYYPHIQLGVPCRIRVRAGGAHLLIPDAQDARAAAPSTTDLDVTDLDVRVDLALDSIPALWPDPAPDTYVPHASAPQEIIGRWIPGGDPGRRMWRVLLDASGRPQVTWSTDGSDLTTLTCAEAVPYRPGERWALRVTLDVDDGAGGHVAQFYVADRIADPWRRLGDPVLGEGATSIHSGGDVPLHVGDIGVLAFPPGAGRYYRAELRDGSGPLLASPDFAGLEPGDTSFTDGQGNAWVLQGAAQITDWRALMVGAVAEWAPHWPYGDLSDPARPDERPGEARVDITVAGILRRLGQGAVALQSTLTRRIPHFAPAAYWPMEDGADSVAAASGLGDGTPLTLRDVQWGQDDSLPGSAALPTLGEAAWMYAPVPAQGTGQWHVEMLYRWPGDWPTTGQQILNLRTSGAPWNRIELRMTAAAFQAVGWSDSGGGDSSATALLINIARPPPTDQWLRIRVMSLVEGGQVALRISWVAAGGGGFQGGATYAGTPGEVTHVDTRFGAELEGVSIGHLAVLPEAGSTAYNQADVGFGGERALTRIRRLAQEERLPISAPGVAAESMQMGPQGIATALELIQECADADGGILSERSMVAGLHYQPRYLMYGQAPALHLDAAVHEIASPLQPVLDDQRIRNHITISRAGGSSAIAADADSVRRSGEYRDTATLSLAHDEQAAGIAHWRLRRGTWPGMRYPQVSTDLTVAPDVTPAWMDATPGTVARVTGLPPQHPPGGVDLMIEGLTQVVSPTHWTATAACSPAGPWRVGEVAPTDPESAPDEPSHVDSDGSELAAAAGPGDAVLWVQATTGPDWIVTGSPESIAEDVPLDVIVGGEVMTVTTIGPPGDLGQPFEVTRAVNGVTKSHAAGADVRLADPMIVAL